MNHLSIRIEGGLLSPDFLETIHEAVGQKPADFGLKPRDSLVDEVSAIWGDVLTYWRAFQRRKARSNESLTTITREQWLLPLLEALGYTLTYQRSAVEQDGRSYLISHRASQDESGPPVHLVAYDQPLGDRPPSGRGTLSPHALVQDYLNRTDDHLWGIVSNGRLLRLLRDSTYFTRPAYIEFDLEGMFNGERLDEFFLLYRLAHRSRLPRPNERPADCLLEQYYQRGLEQGGRIRDGLRQAVAEALLTLGNGFLRHPRNESLRRRLQTGELTPEAYYQQLLYLIYRLLFLMVAEERNLLELAGEQWSRGAEESDFPSAPAPLRSSAAYYRAYFSISRLRTLADTPLSAPERFDDLYLGLRTLFVAFHDETLAAQLGVPPLNGELFSSDNAPDLDAAYLNNRDLLQAIRLLSHFTPSDEKVRRRVNYAALDVEELGSVYESLLDEQPVIDGLPGSRGDGEQGRGDASFTPAHHHPPTFAFVSGTARKTTGSYYTPRELVNELINSALVPVIEERLRWARGVGSREVGSREVGSREVGSREVGSREENEELSRFVGLAEGDGPGGSQLRVDSDVSERGSVRDDLTDSTGGDLDSGKYRRGLGERESRRIHSLSQDSTRLTERSGDPSSAGQSGQSNIRRGDKAASSAMRGVGQDAAGADSVVGREVGGREVGRNAPSPSSLSPYSLSPYSPQEQALLSLRVCDPACGSGHFLLAAARRIGYELAKVRANGDEPSPEATRAATREAITHCIYGVDKNPLAVDLCKVALWIEGHSRGKPLTFLDYRIRCGDSLVGVLDLAALDAGIPDAAFEPVSGDDQRTARGLKKQNKKEREGQMSLFDQLGGTAVAPNAAEWEAFTQMPEDTPAQINAKRARYRELLGWGERSRTAANLWTAAFFSQLTPENLPNVPTSDTLRRWLRGQSVSAQVIGAANALAEAGRFFHWPLEFPQVFAAPSVIPTSPRGGIPTAPEERDSSPKTARNDMGSGGGFDVVLGNPPWEHTELKEKEWFAARDTAIANAGTGAQRKRMIDALAITNPDLHREFEAAKRAHDGISHFVRNSGKFPLCGRGRINTYAIFAELVRHVQSATGRVGIIVPSGIATDDTTKYYFQDIMDSAALVSLYDFENRKGLFPAVDSRMKFCLLTLTGAGRPAQEGAQFVFFAQDVADLRDEERRFTLSAAEIALLNPNTRTCPIFRSKRDAEMTKAIYRRVPVLIKEGLPEVNPWGVSFRQGLFNMTSDSGLFRTREQLEAEGWRLVGNQFVDAVSNRATPENDSATAENGSATPENGSATPENGSATPENGSATPENGSATPENGSATPENGSATVENGSATVENGSATVENGSATVENGSATPENGSATRESGVAVDAQGNARLLPLYEAKMLHHFDHRWATYVGLETRDITGTEKNDPTFFALPRYWVREEEVNGRLPNQEKWFIGFRDITNTTNERTAIFSILGKTAVGHTMPLIFLQTLGASLGSFLLAGIDSLVFDYATRQKVGGTHMTYSYLKQLPVLPPQTYHQPCPWLSPAPPLPRSLSAFLLPRVLELTYTAYDLRSFAQDCGYHGPPFRWDEERRFLLRCELDAAYFHLYGIGREDTAYIMDTFPIVRRKDEAAFGEYRTKRVILEMYDEMAAAMGSEGVGSEGVGSKGVSDSLTPPFPYQTRLDPPPGHPDAAHPWDEAYLGPALPREAWWQAVAEQGSGGAEERSAKRSSPGVPDSRAVREPAPTLELKPPAAPPQAKPKEARQPAPAAQPALVADFTPPQGSYTQRLKRVMALSQPKTQTELAELIAALGDENENIRWLAGSALTRLGGLAVVRLLAAYLQTNPGAVARAEAEKVSGLIAETDEDETVRQAARAALAREQSGDER